MSWRDWIGRRGSGEVHAVPPPELAGELAGESERNPPDPSAWGVRAEYPHVGDDGYWQVPETGGGYLSSVLDASVGQSALVLGGFGVYQGRDLAATYATLWRCVTLLCGMAADLVYNGVMVVDRAGDEVKSAHAGRVVDLLRESPDGLTDAWIWLEDFFTDQLLDGNGIAFTERGSKGVPLAMRLMQSWDARVHETAHGDVYSARTETWESQEMKAATDVVHSRWPRVGGRARQSARRGFATAPVQVMSRAVGIGIAQDRYVERFFSGRDGGAKARTYVSYPAVGAQGVPDAKTRSVLVESVASYASSRKPLVLFGGANVGMVQDTPQDAQALALREFQVRETCRYFGIPVPAAGEHITQWGSGIEQLARQIYRFSEKHHLGRALSAMSWRLLPRGQRLAVDETQLLKGDMEAIGRLIPYVIGSAQQPPVLEANSEIRRLLGYPARDDIEWKLPEGAADAAGMGTPPGQGGTGDGGPGSPPGGPPPG